MQNGNKSVDTLYREDSYEENSYLPRSYVGKAFLLFWRSPRSAFIKPRNFEMCKNAHSQLGWILIKSAGLLTQKKISV